MPTLTLEPQTREAHGKTYFFLPLAGNLDEKNLAGFVEKIEPFFESNHAYLVLDLGEVDLVSSHAMSYLENLHRKLNSTEKRLAFVNANEEILDILEFIGLAKLVAIFDEEEKFMEAIQCGEI